MCARAGGGGVESYGFLIPPSPFSILRERAGGEGDGRQKTVGEGVVWFLSKAVPYPHPQSSLVKTFHMEKTVVRKDK